jgi:hypothetical protein
MIREQVLRYYFSFPGPVLITLLTAAGRDIFLPSREKNPN